MERLNLEQLARLVDEAPTAEEQRMLERDPALRAELEELKAQTRALKDLPSVLPPPAGWAELEAVLTDEGLIQRPGGGGFRISRGWLQAAAALVLFLGGTAMGRTLAPGTGLPVASQQGAAEVATTFVSLDEAAAAVEAAERQWVSTVSEYRRLSTEMGQRQTVDRDPALRFAALQALLATSQAAVREAPGDRFFNSVLIGALAEQEAALRQISQDNWY